MPERGSDRLNVHRDDEMKAELQGSLRADHPTRAEGWREVEPAADDDPEVASGPVPPRGTGSVTEAEDEAFRFELARHLRPSVFPARRGELLSTLHREYAPDQLLDAVRELPEDASFRNVQEVVDALGRKPRS